MHSSEEQPKLRLAPTESAQDLARRLEKEEQARSRQREADLEQSLGSLRVGSSPYLNTVPLTRGIESEMIWAPPAELARMLQRKELDAALVSVAEVLLRDDYDVLDGVAIACLGEVKSVFLAHRRPLAEVREVYCDPASLTSVNLLKVLLGEQGLKAEFKTLPSYEMGSMPDFALLIGDRALDFLHASREHEILDLGTAWYELTRLPFVFAVWALRREVNYRPLCRTLREAKDFGLETLDTIVRERTDYDYEFRKDYLGWHIHYHMGSDEKRGLALFATMLERHGLGPVYPPRFV
jgi:chorismate dehydratase